MTLLIAQSNVIISRYIRTISSLIGFPTTSLANIGSKGFPATRHVLTETGCSIEIRLNLISARSVNYKGDAKRIVGEYIEKLTMWCMLTHTEEKFSF